MELRVRIKMNGKKGLEICRKKVFKKNTFIFLFERTYEQKQNFVLLMIFLFDPFSSFTCYTSVYLSSSHLMSLKSF